eukprot:1153466-Pelagomonas_calceolata.AAC.2
METEEALPKSVKEKEIHWLRSSVSLLHHKAAEEEMLMGIRGITGSTRLQDLAVGGIIVFNSTPSGNKLVQQAKLAYIKAWA